MLLNSIICLTDVITTELWLYTIKLTINVGNNCPDKSGITALECFSSTKGHAREKCFHTFGLPYLILNPKVCKIFIPKWTLHSRQAILLGIFPQHGGNIALVQNLKTGYISPQFHIVFDDNLTTTSATITIFFPDNWEYLFNNHRELPPDEFQFSHRKQ